MLEETGGQLLDPLVSVKRLGWKCKIDKIYSFKNIQICGPSRTMSSKFASRNLENRNVCDSINRLYCFLRWHVTMIMNREKRKTAMRTANANPTTMSIWFWCYCCFQFPLMAPSQCGFALKILDLWTNFSGFLNRICWNIWCKLFLNVNRKMNK